MYKNIIISFIRIIQKNGIKELSELIVYNVFRLIKRLNKKCPFIYFVDSYNKAKPYSEIKQIQISGVNYKVPIEIKPKRQKNLTLRWIITNALKENNDKNIDVSLMKEILNTCNFTSKTIKQRNDFHRIAESNKIYIQYRY